MSGSQTMSISPSAAPARWLSDYPMPSYGLLLSSKRAPKPLPQVQQQPQSPMPTSITYERRLGDTELSYFLPSRADGVNDMYLCIGFRGPAGLVTDARVRTIWAILRTRHPLLASQVQMKEWEYDDARFCYTPPKSADEALLQASASLRISVQGKDDLLDGYLNGPRLLSNEQPARLLFSRDPSTCPPTNGVHVNGAPVNGVSHHARAANGAWAQHTNGIHTTGVHTNGVHTNGIHVNGTSVNGTSVNGAATNGVSHAEVDEQHEFHFCLCTTHFLGDGMALHKTANEFFSLLGGPQTDAEIKIQFQEEWSARWDSVNVKVKPLPQPLEEQLPPVPGSRLAKAASKVDFNNLQRQTIGGHMMPRQKHGPRRTVVPTVPFTPAETKKVLAICKRNGVTISHVVFALCNLVWAKMKQPGNEHLPTMMYSAINLRSWFPPTEDSHFSLAVTYFNIMLPSFIPPALTDAQTLWLRSKSVKTQMNGTVKSKLFLYRTQEMAADRRVTAKRWAKEDDEKEKGIWVAPPPPAQAETPAQPKMPSQALLGLSMLGNLDAVYQHKTFPSLELHTLTTGSRQRAGAMLLFSYTFAGRLWLSLGYDVNGFDRQVVDKFWQGLLDGVKEHLLA